MKRFMITYFGGDTPTSKEAGAAHFQEYQQWLGGLGDAVVSAMNPLKDGHTVTPDGQASAGSQSRMSGYTVLQAESMDEVLAMVQRCPFLSINGTLEVAELVEMG
ncbi:YciI family protein [Reinekea blandensis]|uniref:YCII-related domain-containing protein n=1 Tax=Reinekea blandensis MED297 TaxID=314283 RepID=A4BB76_9GAMM|nr:YciI family protein [Reinekea blandensis]EAR10689.1 hypothetical protein MED297_11755 [Reinekea sp. MED297] [Reinekea blandensis MED297]